MLVCTYYCKEILIYLLIVIFFVLAVFQPYLSWDNPGWHKKCKESGVDFIITDRPELLRETLDKKHK